MGPKVVAPHVDGVIIVAYVVEEGIVVMVVIMILSLFRVAAMIGWRRRGCVLGHDESEWKSDNGERLLPYRSIQERYLG